MTAQWSIFHCPMSFFLVLPVLTDLLTNTRRVAQRIVRHLISSHLISSHLISSHLICPDVLAGVLMETTSGEEVSGFTAAAAVTGNDDHHMEVYVQETGETATKKQRSHPESQHTEPDVSKREWERLKRHSQSIRSSCGHCSNETLVRALRRKGAKPLILRLARDVVCPSCQENSKLTSSSSGKFGSHPSQVAEHTDR